MVRFARHLSQNSQNHDKQRVLRVFFLSESAKRIKNVSKIKKRRPVLTDGSDGARCSLSK